MNARQTFSALLASSLVFGASSFASAGDNDIQAGVRIGSGQTSVDLSYDEYDGDGSVNVRVISRDRGKYDRRRYDGSRKHKRERGDHDRRRYDGSRKHKRERGDHDRRRYDGSRKHKRERGDHERKRYNDSRKHRRDRGYDHRPTRRGHGPKYREDSRRRRYESRPRRRYYEPAPPRRRYGPAPEPYEHNDHGPGYSPQTQQERSGWILLAKGKVYKSQILFGRALSYDEHRASAKFGYAVSAARLGDDYTGAMAMRRAFVEDFGSLSSMPDYPGLYRQYEILAQRMQYEIYEYGETPDRLVLLAGVEILRGNDQAGLEALRQAKYLGDDSYGVKRVIKQLRHN